MYYYRMFLARSDLFERFILLRCIVLVMVKSMATPHRKGEGKRGKEGVTKVEIIKLFLEQQEPLTSSFIFERIRRNGNNRSFRKNLSALCSKKGGELLNYLPEERKYTLPPKWLSEEYVSNIFNNVLNGKRERLSLLFLDVNDKRKLDLSDAFEWNEIIYRYTREVYEQTPDFRVDEVAYMLSSWMETYRDAIVLNHVLKNSPNSSLVLRYINHEFNLKESELLRKNHKRQLQDAIKESNEFIKKEKPSRGNRKLIDYLIRTAETLVNNNTVSAHPVLSQDKIFALLTPASQKTPSRA